MAKKIMIIEDNEMNMKLFHDIIVDLMGYQAIALRTGISAIEIAKLEKPNLIIMDIQLPEISGIELIKMFKANLELKHIPIIAVTAFAMKGDEEQILSYGCEKYLSKPISVKTLRQTIEEMLTSIS